MRKVHSYARWLIVAANRNVMAKQKKTNVRWLIVFMLFIVTAINCADRATVSIAGPAMAKELGLDAVAMGYIFSAWGWAYVIAQLPGGWLLDRFGSKKVYTCSILLWSLFTMGQGAVVFFSGFAAFVVLFFSRFMVGITEAPAFPGNSRIVAAWYPASERGRASAIFNSGQYFALVIFGPIMGWIVYTFGWHYVFVSMGLVGMALAILWVKVIYDPKDHPMINQAEIEYIEEGGGLVNMDQGKKGGAHEGPKLAYVKQLLKNRMLVGVYIAQYCINAIAFFFTSWFPVYLVQARGMSILQAGFAASIPALCGFAGGVLGGIFSDCLLKRGYSLSVARKMPIFIGMICAMSMLLCNYIDVEWIIIAIMGLSYFGKAFGSFGWVINSDTAPKEIAGLSGALMNTCGNVSSITTPIAIGYIVQTTGSFNGALLYVALHAIVVFVSYMFVVGEIKRVNLKAQI